jgi:hypothetical protein
MWGSWGNALVTDSILQTPSRQISTSTHRLLTRFVPRILNLAFLGSSIVLLSIVFAPVKSPFGQVILRVLSAESSQLSPQWFNNSRRN